MKETLSAELQQALKSLSWPSKNLVIRPEATRIWEEAVRKLLRLQQPYVCQIRLLVRDLWACLRANVALTVKWKPMRSLPKASLDMESLQYYFRSRSWSDRWTCAFDITSKVTGLRTDLKRWLL